jgi:hypothetical protein
LIAIDDSDSDVIVYKSGTNNLKASAMSNRKNRGKMSGGKSSEFKVTDIFSCSCESRTDTRLQEVAMWDSDPDFIEYKPRGPRYLERKTSADVSTYGLPEFVRADWVIHFLPTLYHRFGISIDPWNTFSKGEEMLRIVQEVVNTVYPGNMYRAKWGDKICAAVQPLYCLS